MTLFNSLIIKHNIYSINKGRDLLQSIFTKGAGPIEVEYSIC